MSASADTCRGYKELCGAPRRLYRMRMAQPIGWSRRVLAATAIFAIILTACGDQPLSDLGLARDWIDAGRTPEDERRGPQPVPIDPNVPRAVTDVNWYNGWAPQVAPEPQQVVADVWAGSDGSDFFVQASPNEIAAALPGIKVPEVLPPTTVDITSQLMYEGTSGRLDNDIVATFGFWNTEAYSVTRATGQLAILSVAREQESVPAADDPTEGCARFGDSDVSSCEPVRVAGHPGWWVSDIDGDTLIWLDTEYRYELFRRPRLDREMVEQMAGSMVPLGTVRPAPTTESA